jgi:hypothetical protein
MKFSSTFVALLAARSASAFSGRASPRSAFGLGPALRRQQHQQPSALAFFSGGGSSSAAAALRPRHRAAPLHMASVLKLSDPDALLNQVDIFIFDCDGVIWRVRTSRGSAVVLATTTTTKLLTVYEISRRSKRCCFAGRLLDRRDPGNSCQAARSRQEDVLRDQQLDQVSGRLQGTVQSAYS